MELVDAEAGDLVASKVEMFKDNLQRIKVPEEVVEVWTDLGHDELKEKLENLKQEVAGLKKGQ